MLKEVRRFWSHRKGYREALTGEFWSAFDALLRRLINEARGSRSFGIFGSLVREDVGVRGSHLGWRDSALQEAIRELLGRSYYSPFNVNKKSPQKEEHVIDFIEAFHDLAVEKKRPTYTVAVNTLLKRFNQPYELIGGEIHYRGSEVLDEPVESLDSLTVSDIELRKYLVAAREAFFDAREDRRLEGLRSLYDGFERVKTLQEGDKKTSASKIVEELARFEELRSSFDKIFREFTDIGNKANIRHSERDKVVIDQDPVLIEYLFYSVWALIRAVLVRESGNPSR